MLSSTNQLFLMHTGTDFLAFVEQTKTLQLPSCSTGSDGGGGKKHREEWDSLLPLMKLPLQLG